MPVTIRLRRVGRNKQSNFRVVVTEKTAPRDGAYLDAIGFYNPRSRPAELRLDLEKLDGWVAKGAELSETVASLTRKARRGGDRTVKLVPVGGERPKEESDPGAEEAPRGAGPAASAVADASGETPANESTSDEAPTEQ